MKKGLDYTGIAVAFFCHNGNGKYVFHTRSKQTRGEWGTWDCGGGGLEFGETLEDGMFRELQEEYGCTGIIEERLEPNTYLNTTADGQPVHWIIHPFIVRVEEADVIIGEPDKMDELGWFSLDELPDPIHPGVAEDLKRYSEQLRRYSA